MRKRKVTVINSRNVLPKENVQDKRNVVLDARKVVVGANSSSSLQSRENTKSSLNNDSDSDWPRAVMDSYSPKKPKIQSNRRILSVDEDQVEDNNERRIFSTNEAQQSKQKANSFEGDDVIDLDMDVRIILNDESEDLTSAENNVDKDIEVIELDDEEELENIASEVLDIDDATSNDDAEDTIVGEQTIPLRKVELNSPGQNVEKEELDVEEAEDDDEVNENDDIEEEDEVGDEEDEKEYQEERREDKTEEVEEQEEREEGNGKEAIGGTKSDVKGSEKTLDDSNTKENKNEDVSIVKDEVSTQTMNKKIESKQSKAEKRVQQRVENEKKNQAAAEVKSNEVKKVAKPLLL